MEFNTVSTTSDRPVFVDFSVNYLNAQHTNLQYDVHIEETGSGYLKNSPVMIWTIILKRYFVYE